MTQPKCREKSQNRFLKTGSVTNVRMRTHTNTNRDPNLTFYTLVCEKLTKHAKKNLLTARQSNKHTNSPIKSTKFPSRISYGITDSRKQNGDVSQACHESKTQLIGSPHMV